MLGGELGAGRDLDRVRVAQRALGEGREPAQRLDLDVEQLDADGALLRGREDVDDPAAQGELAALLDLLDALVAGADEVGGQLVEVEQVADRDPQRVRAQGRVRHLLRQATAETMTTGAPPRGSSVERVERRDAQAGQVRRRGEVGLVGDAAAG